MMQRVYRVERRFKFMVPAQWKDRALEGNQELRYKKSLRTDQETKQGDGIALRLLWAACVLLLFGATAFGQTTPQFNNRFAVDGVKYPNTQAGVQSASTDACGLTPTGLGSNSGGDLYLQPSVLGLAAQPGQLLLFTCPLGLHGSTGESAIFSVAAGISSAIPVMRFQVTANTAQLGLHIDHFAAQSVTGSATAGDLIMLDSGSSGTGFPGPILTEIDHIITVQGAFNGFDLNTTGQSIAPGVYGLYVHDNLLQNGIRLGQQVGDALLVEHNVLHSRAGSGNPCVDVTQQSGASHFIFENNDMDFCDAGDIFIHKAIQPKIIRNQLESSTSCIGANSAMVDLLGDVGAIDGALIADNNLNAHATCTNNIRFGANATNWRVEGNKISVNNNAGTGIKIIAGSTGGVIGPNSVVLGGTASFVGGDTPAARITVYGNTTQGEPGTRSIAPSDGDNAIVGRRNSATQTAHIIDAQDENSNPLAGVLAGGQVFSVSPGGSNSNASFQAIGSSLPSFDWENTGGAADSKWWDVSTTSTCWQLRTINDANNNALPIMTACRNGLRPTSIINAPVVQNSLNRVAVGTNFTTANNASLQAITGLAWDLPGEARSYSFHCAGSYSQAGANVAVTFGIQASSAPTNIFATGTIYTSPTALTTGVLATLTTTAATSIVSTTPSATGTNFKFELDGTIEIPGVANTITPMVSTAAGTDAVTVLRGSYCNLY